MKTHHRIFALCKLTYTIYKIIGLKLNKISLTLRMKGDIVFLAIQDTGNGFTDAGIKAILSVNIR